MSRARHRHLHDCIAALVPKRGLRTGCPRARVAIARVNIYRRMRIRSHDGHVTTWLISRRTDRPALHIRFNRSLVRLLYPRFAV